MLDDRHFSAASAVQRKMYVLLTEVSELTDQLSQAVDRQDLQPELSAWTDGRPAYGYGSSVWPTVSSCCAGNAKRCPGRTGRCSTR